MMQPEAALRNALALARGMGDSAGVLHSLGSLSSVHLVRGEYETSAALAREALTLCGQMGQAYLRRIPQAILGATAAGLGDKDLAHRCLAESLSIARKVSDRSEGIFW